MQFSNDDKDVFLVKIHRMIDRGALLSRYSRASNLDIRDVYRKEFEGNEDRGKDFYRRVFTEYGDESIAELVTAQMAVQNVSNVLTKTMEELRVGLSFLEKSSRYVRYDKQVNGRYLYLDPSRAGVTGADAGEYVENCDALFDFYAENYEPAMEFFRERYPMESIVFGETGGENVHIDDMGGDARKDAEKSYRSAIRARALDDLRFLLPAATVTNLGISGNGRAFINLVQKLMSMDAPEAKSLAGAIYSELEGEFPELINAAVSDHGSKLVDYQKEMNAFDPGYNEVIGKNLPEVELLDYDDGEKAIRRVVSIMAFANGDGDLSSTRKEISRAATVDLSRMVEKLASLRKNRRHKIHRAFETVPYLFQITSNYGAFRDLQRHRFISIVRQPLTDSYGYDTPEYFASSSAAAEYGRVMEHASRVYHNIRAHSGRTVAQYVLPYAYRYPVSAYLNLREATFFCELRSTPQAHPDLRRIAISMADEIARVNPELSPVMRFVDRGEYALGRLKAEQRKERKLRELDRDSGQ